MNLHRLHKVSACTPWVVMTAICVASAGAGADPVPNLTHNARPYARPALAGGALGLYDAEDFRLASGRCTDCAAGAAALWYFGDDVIAAPRAGVPAAGQDPTRAAQDDVRSWYADGGAGHHDRPALIWLGSPEIMQGARLEPGGHALKMTDGSDMTLALTPRIASNRSWYDDSTAAFFAQRTVQLRGRTALGPDGTPVFTARTLWPEDYTLADARVQPLAAGESLESLVRATPAGATDRYQTRVLWERAPGAASRAAGHPVLGIMLNGAQGDDDEALGGHFAIVTGRTGAHGEMSDWLVNNIYGLDSYSEKGIIAGVTPMDNYLMDLNSGQSYYRPSYLLVAVLKSDRAAYAYQGAVDRVYGHFYRHGLPYEHARSNCAGISMDTLRSLGWNIPERGATGRFKAYAAYPYMAVKDMSLKSGRSAYEYLSEEQTRLYPAVAFDAAGGDLLRLSEGSPRAPGGGALERMLAEDVEAIIYVHIPQLPSSRAYGTFPVFSLDEYMKRVPEDRSQWKIVPAAPRPFPPALLDEAARRESGGGARTVWAVVLIMAGAALAMLRLWRRRRQR